MLLEHFHYHVQRVRVWTGLLLIVLPTSLGFLATQQGQTCSRARGMSIWSHSPPRPSFWGSPSLIRADEVKARSTCLLHKYAAGSLGVHMIAHYWDSLVLSYANSKQVIEDARDKLRPAFEEVDKPKKVSKRCWTLFASIRFVKALI